MKVFELDPRHKKLLEDHSSGYWWIRPTKENDKYKGRIIFSVDFGFDLSQSVTKRAGRRRLYSWLVSFKRTGYIFRNVDFIKLLNTLDASLDMMNKAMEIKIEKVRALKAEVRHQAVLERFGPSYKTIKIINPGSRKSLLIWVWSFKNTALGLEYIHVFHFNDEGMEIGKRRRLFADKFGLSYASLQKLAAGKLKIYKGWELIDSPRQITYQQAIEWKIQQLKDGSKY